MVNVDLLDEYKVILTKIVEIKQLMTEINPKFKLTLEKANMLTAIGLGLTANDVDFSLLMDEQFIDANMAKEQTFNVYNENIMWIKGLISEAIKDGKFSIEIDADELRNKVKDADVILRYVREKGYVVTIIDNESSHCKSFEISWGIPYKNVDASGATLTEHITVIV